MHYLKTQHMVYIDVDDTLVMWNKNESFPRDTEGVVEFSDPYREGISLYLKPHRKHLELMHTWKKRGYGIVVWSAGGAPWAKEVVETLKLEHLVDVILTKPEKYVDDLQANAILGTRVYITQEG